MTSNHAGYTAPLRDRITVRVCNILLTLFASKHYNDMLKAAIIVGLAEAAKTPAVCYTGEQPATQGRNKPCVNS